MKAGRSKAARASKQTEGQPSLHATVQDFLDTDKLEASKVSIAAFVKTNAATDPSSPDSKLLSILERSLQVFSASGEQGVEEQAKQLMDDMIEADLENTTTGKRLAGLMAILHEASQRLAKVQGKVASSQKVKLPSDYYEDSGYTQLKSKHLVVAAQKRITIEAAQKEIASMSDYGKTGIFSKLKFRLEEIKDQIEQFHRIKERVNGFWMERQRENYSHPTSEMLTKKSIIADDFEELHELFKAYEKAVFRDDEIEKELILIECFVTGIDLIRSPSFKRSSPTPLHSAILQELVARPELAECLLVNQLSPSEDDDFAFIRDIEGTIKEDAGKAKGSKEGLRKVFGYVNKVSKLSNTRRTPIQMVVLNRCIEICKEWYISWKKKMGKSNLKMKDQDRLTKAEALEFFKHINLDPEVVKQLVKLTKKVKQRLEERAIEPNEWPFKQSINSERQKLNENYKFFKGCIEYDSPEVKNQKPKLKPERKPHVDENSIPRAYENMAAHVDTRGFHNSLTNQLMVNSAFSLDKMSAAKVADGVIRSLQNKITDPLRFTLVVRRFIKFMKILRSMKLTEVSRYMRKTDFKVNVIGKLAGKTEDELRKLEKSKREGGEILLGKSNRKDLVNLEEGNLIENKQNKRSLLQASSNKAKKTARGALLSPGRERKHSVQELDDDMLPMPSKPLRKGLIANAEEDLLNNTETDRLFENLTRRFNKRRDMILEGIDIGDGTGSDYDAEFSEEDRCSVVDEPAFVSSKIVNEDQYFKLFSGKLVLNDGGIKKKHEAEIFTVYGEDFIKNFDIMKPKTPLVLKPSTKEFQSYIDKVLLSADRIHYLVLPCFTNVSDDISFCSSMTRVDSVASMKYSDHCKVFIFPPRLLKPGWLDVLNFVLLKESEEDHDPNLIAMIVCKLDALLPRVASETSIVPAKMKVNPGGEMYAFTRLNMPDGTKEIVLSNLKDIKDGELVPPPESNVNKLNRVWFKAYEVKKKKVESNTNHRAGKKSVYTMKKNNLMRLVEEPDVILREIGDDFGPRPVKSSNGMRVEPLVESPPAETIVYTEMPTRHGRGMGTKNNLEMGDHSILDTYHSGAMQVELDPFASNLYGDQPQVYYEAVEDVDVDVEESGPQRPPHPSSRDFRNRSVYSSGKKTRWEKDLEGPQNYNEFME